MHVGMGNDPKSLFVYMGAVQLELEGSSFVRPVFRHLPRREGCAGPYRWER